MLQLNTWETLIGRTRQYPTIFFSLGLIEATLHWACPHAEMFGALTEYQWLCVYQCGYTVLRPSSKSNYPPSSNLVRPSVRPSARPFVLASIETITFSPNSSSPSLFLSTTSTLTTIIIILQRQCNGSGNGKQTLLFFFPFLFLHLFF